MSDALMNRRSFCLAVSAALAAGPLRAFASQAYPNRSIRIISPYAAGGGPDVQLRQAGPVLGEALGQTIVIENKVGAAGVLAAQYVGQQPPDGYTLIMGSNAHLIQKILQPQLDFDPIRDFTPVGNLVSSPTVLVVNAQSPYQKIDDLIADAHARPGVMNYCSGGLGSSAHLAGATLASLATMQVTHIPLRGSVEIAASLLRGDTHYAFPIASTAIPQVEGGKLRALAVTSGERLSQLPDIPTLKEVLGSDLAVQESWLSLWAPAGTPRDVVARLHAATVRTARTPSIEAAFRAAGSRATPSESPEAFAEFVLSENEKWKEIIELAGVTVTS